jgi:hypothetical protein
MTALTQMAAARPPGIADARVPCPLCGGLIHPVAGRCKHCKEDLTSFRAGRPQAAAALPALNGKPAASTNGTNGHAVAAVTATPVPVVVAAHEGSQPILPPRTTARSMAAARPHSIWRSWPMLVIVLAVIAIVAATVIMIIPPGGKKHDGKMSAPPAPERMETNPLPEKSSQLDPWDKSQGGGVPGGAMPAPAPQPQPAQPQAPAPADPDDDDIWGGSGGVMGGIAGGSALGGTAFMITVLDHACTKLKSCPNSDQSTLSVLCDNVAMMPKAPNPGCPAAQKCLDAIDHLSCSQTQASSPMELFSMFQDCSDAANC